MLIVKINKQNKLLKQFMKISLNHKAISKLYTHQNNNHKVVSKVMNNNVMTIKVI